MRTPKSASVEETRQRILAAAARVFAQRGLAGATTRAIASTAGVNEVTLFRHFGTKDRLLAAVVGKNFGAPDLPAAEEPPAATADLRGDLISLGRAYQKLLADNLPLVRTMIGEIQHRHRNHERQVFKALFRPIKAAFISRMETARAAGELRADLKAAILSDLFSGMLFTNVLRCSAPDYQLDYAADEYLPAAVDLLLRGAAPLPPEAAR